MNELTMLLGCLSCLLDSSTLRQLTAISEALLTMTGRVTLLGISRWAGKGGSYRTIQRFFVKPQPWGKLNWTLAKASVKASKGAILIAGDATTVTKSGKETFGLGRFFSSIYSRAVPGIAFQTLSLVDTATRKSWPILMEQIQPPPKPETPAQPKAAKTHRRRGRPKGSKNRNSRDVQPNAEMLQVQTMLKTLLELVRDTVQPAYFVYDGAFGNHAAVQMTRQTGLHLISKLRNNSALHFQWEGAYSGKGRRRTYGERVDYDNLPATHLKSEQTHHDIRTRTYQFKAIHKKFADPLNVAIIHKENLKTGKTAKVILFSTDLELGADALVDYYRLRFQIEFNFRDAKQHWGLEDFMVTRQQAVFNSANLSLFMVNVSQTLLAASDEAGILDLKARYHGLCYAREAFKILPETANVINFEDWIRKVPVLGRVHERKMAA
ncbi:MAG: transposase [Gammaproteobacteria bacterium]|nr:transposase [Gammaproteobacteria bacterium]